MNVRIRQRAVSAPKKETGSAFSLCAHLHDAILPPASSIRHNAMARTTRSSTSAKKRNKQEEEEEDDEEEEEVQPKKTRPTRKAAAPPKKKQQQAEDEEEEPAPRKPAVKKSRVKNATSAAPDTEEHVVGEVDPEFTQSGNAKVTIDAQGRAYDAVLVFVEGTSDKYYLLQVIEDKKKFTCYSRWGRTGSKGQQQKTGPSDEATAVREFEKKFQDKTGNSWDQFVQGKFKHKNKKYDCLANPVASQVKLARASGVNWEYEVNDNVAGKANGWYAYDSSNADEVEAVYQTYESNPQSTTNLTVRTITSDSSGFAYKVDMVKMTQTNASTGKVRAIRRVNPQNFDFTSHTKKQKSKQPKGKPTEIALADFEQMLHLSAGKLAMVKDAADLKAIETYAEYTMDHFEGSELGFRGAFQYLEATTTASSFHDDVKNRKLVWCGVNTTAQLELALQTGELPLVPGRAGRGIYGSYTLSQAVSRIKTPPDAHHTGAVLLVEMCAGRENMLTQDQAELTSAPHGFDSVLLQGRVEPQGKPVEITVQGRKLKMPSSKPKPVDSEHATSSFAETELVVYEQDRAKIRFVVALEWPSELELADPPAVDIQGAHAEAIPEQEEPEEEDYEDEEEE